MSSPLFLETLKLVATFVVVVAYSLLGVGLLGYWIGGLA